MIIEARINKFEERLAFTRCSLVNFKNGSTIAEATHIKSFKSDKMKLDFQN